MCAPVPRLYDGLLVVFPPDMPLLTEASALLLLLLALHLYWTYLLVRIGYRIITESAEQASREEYEGESDVDDEPETPASIASPLPDACASGALDAKKGKAA